MAHSNNGPRTLELEDRLGRHYQHTADADLILMTPQHQNDALSWTLLKGSIKPDLEKFLNLMIPQCSVMYYAVAAAENQLINVREAFSGLFFHHQHLPFSRAINQIQNLAFKTSHLQCDPAKKSREYTKYYKVEWVILNQVIAILTKNSAC